jgi:hypothetical protein
MTEVDHPGKLRPWFRRRLFLGLLFLLASPLLLFFLSNLWLALPCGRDWVAGKISARLGFQARISNASWSPWRGVSVSGLVIEQPEDLRGGVHEPLFAAQSIRIWPVWRAWLQKRMEVHSIEVDSPRLVVPLQLLAHLAGPAQIVIAPPPAVVATTPPAVAVIPPMIQAPPPPSVPPMAALPTPPAAAPGPPQPTGWIHVREASLCVVSSGRAEPLFEASGFNAVIPAAGDPADSLARLSSIRILQNGIADTLELPLHWQSPALQIGPVKGQLHGVPYQLTAKVARLGNLPLEVLLEVPIKSDATVAVPGGGTASARQFRAAGRFVGLLTSPSSWQGDLVMEGNGLSLSSPPRPEFRFDQGGAIVVLRGGVLSCTDARLIGDHLSLLGNATVLSDSRSAAILRIVVPPDHARGISERIGRDVGKRIAFGTMGSPDRVGTDLYALGNLDGIQVQLGQGGDVIDGPTLLALLKAKAAASQ